MMSTTIAANRKASSNAFASSNEFTSSKATKMTDAIVIADKSVSAAGKSRRFASIASPTAGKQSSHVLMMSTTIAADGKVSSHAFRRKRYRRKNAVIASNHSVETVIFFEDENDD